MRKIFHPILIGALGVSLIPAALANAIEFLQTDLASNATDPDLVNSWGIVASSSSPFWLGANGSGKSLVYTGAGIKNAGLVVSIPGDGTVTGVAFNGGGLTNFNGDVFLFASEDGTFSGWRGALGTSAETLGTGDSGKVYKGLSDANMGGNEYAYLANFKSGKIDVLKGNGAAPDLAGTFTDPNLPAGYAPFNVMNLGNSVYVTYAVTSGGKDDVPGPGNGIVDKFDLQGNFVARLVSPGNQLDSPWGLALAPSNFGDVGGDLLVGNFGNGQINAFDPTTGAFVETLTDLNGNPLVIDGLWGLAFGNGGNAGPANTLFFTAGPDEENGGLFGRLTAVPEPASWVLTGFSLLGLCAFARSGAAKKAFRLG